jgi:hypothetical protein
MHFINEISIEKVALQAYYLRYLQLFQLHHTRYLQLFQLHHTRSIVSAAPHMQHCFSCTRHTALFQLHHTHSIVSAAPHTALLKESFKQ